MDNIDAVVIIVVILIVVLVFVCKQHKPTFNKLNAKHLFTQMKRTSSKNIIDGTDSTSKKRSEIIAGTVSGVTVATATSSVAANLLGLLKTSGSDGPTVALQPIEGEVVGSWALYRDLLTGEVQVFNSKIWGGELNLYDFFRNWSGSTDYEGTESFQNGVDLLQSGNLVRTASKNVVYTITAGEDQTEQFITSPTLLLENIENLVKDASGNLIVPIQENLEMFSDIALQVLTDSIRIAKDLGILLEENLVFFMEAAFSSL
jgi:hypothetical protein